jgi:hypothetical protein
MSTKLLLDLWQTAQSHSSRRKFDQNKNIPIHEQPWTGWWSSFWLHKFGLLDYTALWWRCSSPLSLTKKTSPQWSQFQAASVSPWTYSLLAPKGNNIITIVLSSLLYQNMYLLRYLYFIFLMSLFFSHTTLFYILLWFYFSSTQLCIYKTINSSLVFLQYILLGGVFHLLLKY